MRERIEAAILDIPELLSYRIWHDNPLDGYSVVLRGEQDVARLVSHAIMRVIDE